MNLLCGCLAVVFISRNNLATASWFVMAATMLDFLDGYSARLLKAYSPLGVQLDSMADMVTFGVLPALMIYHNGMTYADSWTGASMVGFFAAVSAVSAGLRLGRFNVDDRPREFFWGLATPAGAILVAGWTWAQYTGQDFGWGMGDKPWLGLVIPIFLAVMFQVALKLPGLKSPKAGIVTAGILGVAVVVGFLMFGAIAIAAGIAGYVVLGILNLFIKWY